MNTALPPPPIRVVLVGLPQLTRDLIARILDKEPEIHVVGEVGEAEAAVPVRRLIEEAGADIVIVGYDAPALLTECHQLLDEHAPWRVLAVSSDARDAHLYGVRPYAMAIDEFSLDSVLEIVRKSASSGPRNPVSTGRSETADPNANGSPDR
jgi:DNA-binding NarL/FixJ family response regulator